MTHPDAISLIVVSRDRPHALRRLLSALRFQTHPAFEVIVVSDQKSLDGYPGADRIRHAHFGYANISAARNIGLRMARAALVAFCDDDAVPDPWWLERLVRAFDTPSVGIAGGFVRGRNGITYQWTAVGCDRFGDDVALPTGGMDPVVRRPADGVWPRVHGTNCAFRTQALRDAGGFDEGFAFFLDETDVCLRMGDLGWDTAIVPDAQVHHGYAESAQRSANRVPRTLFDIGASKALFLRKHATGDPSASLAALRTDRRAQLLRLMVDGRIEPRDVSRLMATLETGLADTRASSLPTSVLAEDTCALVPFNSTPAKGAEAVACTRLSFQSAINFSDKARQNCMATLILKLSFTTLFHKRAYDERGFWLQKGGIFGKSYRQDAAIRVTTLTKRAVSEVQALNRVFPVRRLTVLRKFRNSVSYSPQSPPKG